VSAPAWLIDTGGDYARQVQDGLASALPAGLWALPPGRLPGVRATVRRALEAAGQGGGPLACRHLLADARVLDRAGGPSLCAHHPEAGLSCGECMDSHRDGHQAAATCDGCGGDGWLRPMVQPVAARTFVMRKLDGGTTLGTGPMLVEGLAVCSGCVGGVGG
jgi:hypothetical protein